MWEERMLVRDTAGASAHRWAWGSTPEVPGRAQSKDARAAPCGAGAPARGELQGHHNTERKMHRRVMPLSHPETIPLSFPTLSLEKLFHETGPWSRRGWRLLVQGLVGQVKGSVFHSKCKDKLLNCFKQEKDRTWFMFLDNYWAIWRQDSKRARVRIRSGGLCRSSGKRMTPALTRSWAWGFSHGNGETWTDLGYIFWRQSWQDLLRWPTILAHFCTP